MRGEVVKAPTSPPQRTRRTRTQSPVRILFVGLFLCVLSVLHGGEVYAQFQMPDPKQMSGIPRPVDDLPAGSVSVRLIRGRLTNNIAGQPVDLHVGGNVQTVKTDEGGRAQFDKLPAGA